VIDPAPGSFSRVFFAGMMLRIGLAVGVMALSYGGSAIGEAVDGAWAPFLGAVAGLALGIALVALVLRRLGSRS
jgi:nitrate reductase gamma subunit